MLRPSECVGCRTFPCTDVEHSRYTVPDIAIDPATVRIILISEAAPAAPADGYYTGAGSLFAQTTVEAFQDAGAAVRTSDDVLGLGVYLTTAVKCGKTGYAIATPTVHECSMILAEELALFPNVRALLLMGDVAIKAINAIAKRAGEPRDPGGRHIQAARRSVLVPGDARLPVLSPGRAELLHREEQTQGHCRGYCCGACVDRLIVAFDLLPQGGRR